MRQKIRIGCDPGKSGGLCAIYEDGTLKMFKTPLVNKEIDINKFKNLLVDMAGDIDSSGNWVNDILVVVEDVHAIFGSSATSTFNFGYALGILEGIVCTLDLPMVKVQPKVWQKICFEGIPVTYKAGKPKFNKTTNKTEPTQKVDTKSMALQFCKRLYPNISFKGSERSEKDHEGIVDSLCLAHYGKIKL